MSKSTRNYDNNLILILSKSTKLVPTWVLSMVSPYFKSHYANHHDGVGLHSAPLFSESGKSVSLFHCQGNGQSKSDETLLQKNVIKQRDSSEMNANRGRL